MVVRRDYPYLALSRLWEVPKEVIAEFDPILRGVEGVIESHWVGEREEVAYSDVSSVPYPPRPVHG